MKKGGQDSIYEDLIGS